MYICWQSYDRLIVFTYKYHSCPFKVNRNTIELAVDTSCYSVIDLLCVISTHVCIAQSRHNKEDMCCLWQDQRVCIAILMESDRDVWSWVNVCRVFVSQWLKSAWFCSIKKIPMIFWGWAEEPFLVFLGKNQYLQWFVLFFTTLQIYSSNF